MEPGNAPLGGDKDKEKGKGPASSTGKEGGPAGGKEGEKKGTGMGTGPEQSEQKEAQVDPMNILGSISPLFRGKSPSNVMKGVGSGLGTLAASATLSLAIVVALPVKFAIEGNGRYGFCGGVGGALAGTVMGGLGAAVITTYGACSCLWSSMIGLYRTPFAIVAVANGRSWDEDAKEWVAYDLSIESGNLLTMSEAEFCESINAPDMTPKQFFSGAVKQEGMQAAALIKNGKDTTDASEGGMGAKKAARPAKKKNVMDRELYDTLAIEPEATASEIKKAYYLKARQNHPDRNPNDAEAKSKFQKIGDAYQILGDEKMRHTYDMKGKPAVEGQKSMDAAMIYTIIFGSEDFEHIIGELQIASQMKAATEAASPGDGLADAGGELYRFKQRKRELQCAVLLAAKLDEYAVYNEEEVFHDKARKEAETLAETKLGGTLLGLIGSIYVQRGRAQLSHWSYMESKMSRVASNVAETFSCISYSFGTAYGAYQMSEAKKAAELKQKAEDDANDVPEEVRQARDAETPVGPGNALKSLMGPNPTMEERVRVQHLTKSVSGNFCGLLWNVTKGDITATLTHVCRKVLRDHSVSEEVRRKRAHALQQLGETYCKLGVSEAVGLAEFIDKMGTQTGLFGEEPPGGGEGEGEKDACY